MYLSPLNYIQNEINLTVISNYPGLQQTDLGWNKLAYMEVETNWPRLKRIDLGWNIWYQFKKLCTGSKNFELIQKFCTGSKKNWTKSKIELHHI